MNQVYTAQGNLWQFFFYYYYMNNAVQIKCQKACSDFHTPR